MCLGGTFWGSFGQYRKILVLLFSPHAASWLLNLLLEQEFFVGVGRTGKEEGHLLLHSPGVLGPPVAPTWRSAEEGVISSSLFLFQGSAERLLRITTGTGEAAQGLKRGHPVPFEALGHI